MGEIRRLISSIEARPVRSLILFAAALFFIKLVWHLTWLNLNPLDPADPRFNPKYFRFSNYEYDPYYMEEVARAVFPKGMSERDVDDILITDIMVSKSRNSDSKNHVYYIYVSAPWRLLNHSHSVLYDDDDKLVDVFPGNGRGIYSKKHLDELRAERERTR